MNKTLLALALSISLITVAGGAYAESSDMNGAGIANTNSAVSLQKNQDNDFTANQDNDITKTQDNDITTAEDNDITKTQDNDQDNDTAISKTKTEDNDFTQDNDTAITKIKTEDNDVTEDNDTAISKIKTITEDNDVTEDNDITEDNDQDNDIVTTTTKDSHDVNQDGLINANGGNAFTIGNAAGAGSTIFDGDINGLAGGANDINSGIMSHSIVGDGSASFSNVGVGVNGPVNSDVNNTQTTVLTGVTK